MVQILFFKFIYTSFEDDLHLMVVLFQHISTYFYIKNYF